MLARIHKAMEEKDEGFTLIELLVVMIIIGILAAIAIPVFMSQKKKAYETSLKADLHQIATNIETAMTDNPATVAVAAGAASANGNNTVTITPSTGSAITVGLSSDNSFVALTGNGTGNTIDSNDGVYCVELEHGTSASAPHWKIVSDGTSQTVQSGTC